MIRVSHIKMNPVASWQGSIIKPYGDKDGQDNNIA